MNKVYHEWNEKSNTAIAMETAKEWREFYQKTGAVATCEYPDWLLDGCPECGNKTWHVTNDGWAYCVGCRKGYLTDYNFTRASLSYLDENGLHCFMCRGFGTRHGKICDECGGRITQLSEEQQ